jgi:hypothetical protein
MVGSRFHLKPLVPLLSDRSGYGVLALAREHVRLFRGSRFSLAEVRAGDAFDAALAVFDEHEPQREVQFHTATPARAGRRDARFFGTGGTDRDEREDLARFARAVDAALGRVPGSFDEDPLVVLAAEPLASTFHRESRHPRLTRETLPGTVHDYELPELHRRSWELVAPLAERERTEAADRFRALLAQRPERVARRVEEIVPAARHGRVESLFAATGTSVWGRYDPVRDEVRTESGRKPGAEDLLDRSTVETLRHGGRAYVVEPDRVPAEGPVAAVLRY